MKNVADAIIITNSKKNNLVNELMGAGTTAAIVSGVCMVAACIIKCTTEFGYEALRGVPYEKLLPVGGASFLHRLPETMQDISGICGTIILTSTPRSAAFSIETQSSLSIIK